MAQEAQQARVQLAKYATALHYGELPGPVAQHAKDANTDAVAAIAFRAGLPWSRIVVDYARRLDWLKVDAAKKSEPKTHATKNVQAADNRHAVGWR